MYTGYLHFTHSNIYLIGIVNVFLESQGHVYMLWMFYIRETSFPIEQTNLVVCAFWYLH